MKRFATLVLAGFALAGLPALSAEPDPAVLSYTLPADFKWVESTTYPGLKSAVLYGDPGKPGPYAVRNRFAPGTYSKPHFHPNDRLIVVVAGTWWVGSGEKFDKDATKPMPTGSFIVHYGGKVHFDGAKTEACEIIIYGNGPANSTRVGES
ncbi:MAG: cupin domain-containing protein [Pseudomonadota bacterium]